jgi:cold shock CspA family protein
MSSADFASRVRTLATASRNNTLKKSLGIGDFRLTGWLGGVDDAGNTAPRIRMETIDVEAKGLPNAIKKYMSQFKNQGLPDEAFDSETGLVIIRVESREQPRAFPADTPSITGKVKFWKELEGTGYVTADGVDYFVHHNEIVGDAEVFKTLKAGQMVHFIPSTRKSKGEDKPIACAVTTEE